MTVFLKNLDLSTIERSRRRNAKTSGPITPFPAQLYRMLREVEAQGLDYIISWLGDGRSFQVHEPEEFVKQVLPRYFRCSKMKSFQRQLNFYKFVRAVNGPMEGSYSHPQFIKGQEHLIRGIKRQQDPKPQTLEFNNKEFTGAMSMANDEDSVVSQDWDLSVLGKLDSLHFAAGRRDSFQNLLDESSFGFIEPERRESLMSNARRESFPEGKRFSFAGKNFFFLPVEFSDFQKV